MSDQNNEIVKIVDKYSDQLDVHQVEKLFFIRRDTAFSNLTEEEMEKVEKAFDNFRQQLELIFGSKMAFFEEDAYKIQRIVKKDPIEELPTNVVKMF